MNSKRKQFSPVIYWTSEWQGTGEYETRSTKDNKAIKVEKRILKGKLNKESSGYQRALDREMAKRSWKQ